MRIQEQKQQMLRLQQMQKQQEQLQADRQRQGLFTELWHPPAESAPPLGHPAVPLPPPAAAQPPPPAQAQAVPQAPAAEAASEAGNCHMPLSQPRRVDAGPDTLSPPAVSPELDMQYWNTRLYVFEVGGWGRGWVGDGGGCVGRCLRW